MRSDDSVKLYLNYDDKYYEDIYDIYAGFALSLCKYGDYYLNPGKEGLEKRVKHEFKQFLEEDSNYRFQFEKNEIDSLVNELDQIVVTIYIRMYKKKISK